MQQGQIHDEVNRHAFAGTSRGQPRTFEQQIGSCNVLAKPVAQHKANVWLFDVILKLDGNPDTDAVALHDAAYSVALLAIDTDALDPGFAVSISMIDIRHVGQEFRHSGKRLFGHVEFVGNNKRLSDRLLFHDLFAATRDHCRQIFRNHFVRPALHVHTPVVHPDRVVGKAAHGIEIVGYKENRDSLMLELLNTPDASLLEETRPISKISGVCSVGRCPDEQKECHSVAIRVLC